MKKLDNKGWKKVRFGEVCRNLNVTVKSPEQNGYDKVIGLENIESGSLHIKTWGVLADGTTFTKTFEPGHVLFGKRRAYLKKAAFAEFKGLCSGDILVFEAITKVLHPKLLPFIVSSDRFFDYAVKTSAGSLSPRTKFQDLANFEFSLPPIDQQEKLAELLWAGDDMIQSENNLLSKFLSFRKSTMQELLNGRNLNSYELLNWRRVNICDIGILNTSSVDKKTNQNEKSVNLLNYMDVYSSFDKRITKDLKLMEVTANDNQLVKNQLHIGDVVFTPSSETPDDIGHSAVIMEELPNTLHSYHLVRLSFKEDIDLNFKRYIFNNPEVLKSFELKAKGVTRFTLSLDDFNKTEVLLPPLNIQKKIASTLSRNDSEILNLRKKMEMTKLLYNGLRNQIFN